MPTVTSIFARRVVQAASRDIDAAATLRSVGLDPDAPFDVGQRIAAEAYYDMLERVAHAMPDAHTLPVRVGPLMQHDDYGALGLAWKSAPTVRASLQRVERYCRLWTDNMTYENRPIDGGVLFVLHRAGERRLGMRLSNECTVASAVGLIRRSASRGFRPRAIYFKHAAPRVTSAHEQFFGCPVRFGEPLDALSIADEALERPNHLGDDGISRFLLERLEEEIHSLGDEESLADQLRREISRSLSAGVPRMADVARRMATSERNLRRRLAERGLSFKDQVDATRRDLAQSLLRQSEFPLSEIAFLTGFSDQSAFQRAFKRWTGATPNGYRSKAGDRRNTPLPHLD